MRFADDQASSIIELEDGTVITKCDQCRQLYAEREPPETPPCNTCRAELRESNEEVAMVYMMTRGQVITAGQGQIMDISIPAVKIAMDIRGVKDQWNCLQRVRRLFHEMRGKDEG